MFNDVLKHFCESKYSWYQVYNGIRRKIVIKRIPWSESRKIYLVGFMVPYNFQFEFAKRRKWTPGNKIKLLGLNWSDLIGYWQWRQPIHCIDSRWKPVTWQHDARDHDPGDYHEWQCSISLYNYPHISDILYSHKFRHDTAAFSKRVSNLYLHDLHLNSCLIRALLSKNALQNKSYRSECCSGGGS